MIMWKGSEATMKQTIECNQDMFTLYNKAVELKKFINEYEHKISDAYKEFDQIQDKLIDLDEANNDDWFQYTYQRSGFQEMRVRDDRFENKYDLVIHNEKE